MTSGCFSVKSITSNRILITMTKTHNSHDQTRHDILPSSKTFVWLNTSTRKSNKSGVLACMHACVRECMHTAYLIYVLGSCSSHSMCHVVVATLHVFLRPYVSCTCHVVVATLHVFLRPYVSCGCSYTTRAPPSVCVLYVSCGCSYTTRVPPSVRVLWLQLHYTCSSLRMCPVRVLWL